MKDFLVTLPYLVIVVLLIFVLYLIFQNTSLKRRAANSIVLYPDKVAAKQIRNFIEVYGFENSAQMFDHARQWLYFVTDKSAQNTPVGIILNGEFKPVEVKEFNVERWKRAREEDLRPSTPT